MVHIPKINYNNITSPKSVGSYHEKDFLFESDKYICDLRIAAVLAKNNKLLVQRDKTGNVYALPGGHVNRRNFGRRINPGNIRRNRRRNNVQSSAME